MSKSQKRPAMMNLAKTIHGNNSIYDNTHPPRIDKEFIEKYLTVTHKDVMEFEESLAEGFAETRIEDLLGDIYKKTLESIIIPLGLGRFISLYDRVGGNVDTVHNVRNSVGSDKFKEAYDSRGEYNSVLYHHDERYIAANRKFREKKQDGTLQNSYSAENISQNQPMDLDHVISANEIHNDPARVLAEISGVELANAEINLKPTDRSTNRSKKAKPMSEFVEYLDASREKRQKEISGLKQNPDLTDQERKHLDKLEALESADKELMMKADEIARKEYNKKINQAYYTSSKFYKDLGVSSFLEGAKMGFQQAVGLLCVGLTNAIFDEVVDVCKHGFASGVDSEKTFETLKIRLRRVAVTVWMDWRKIVAAFRDGAVSGIISNLISAIINISFTTAKNVIRLIREGMFVLYRAAKSILFPPKDMGPAEAWDSALKIIVAGTGTIGGIVLSEAVEKIIVSMPLLAGFAPTLSVIISGIVTGVATSVALFAIDKWDPFGMHDLKKRRHIREKMLAIHEEHITSLDNLCEQLGIV